MPTVIVIAIVLLIGWFLLAAPQRRRTRSHAAMQDSLKVSDEIITAGGLHGIVRELGESELKVEIAPDVVVTLDRRAVAAVAEEVVDEVDEVEEVEETPNEVPTELEDETPSESR